MRKSYVTHYNILSSLGFDARKNFDQLVNLKSGIQKYKRKDGEPYFSSLIDKKKINYLFSKLDKSNTFTSLEKMMILSLKAVLEKSNYSITDKTGLIISTTKGNIDVLAKDSPFYQQQERAYLSALGNQIRNFFQFKDDAIVLSNACVTGILAVAVADRLIKSKKYDEVLIVSGDLVTEFVLSGFTSFQALSDSPCKPFSINRSGITIGEAIASILVVSDASNPNNKVEIIGSGSRNDANHISGPSRTGEGLFLSIKSALEEAQITEKNIDYISAHGTATMYNDEMESIAFNRLNMSNIPLNSLKGYYGHTLGSSGLLESVIGIESLMNNTLISSFGFDKMGVSHSLNIIKKTTHKNLTTFLKTASGFGGSNTAVIFKKTHT